MSKVGGKAFGYYLKQTAYFGRKITVITFIKIYNFPLYKIPCFNRKY